MQEFIHIITSPAFVALYITALLKLWSLPMVRDKVFAKIPTLPTRIQWVAPLVLAMLAAAGQGWLDGLRGEALLEVVASQGGQVGAMAIGFYHTYKRVVSAGPTNVAKLTIRSLACVMLLSGCAKAIPMPVNPCKDLYCLEWSGIIPGLPANVLVCAETELLARQAARVYLDRDPKSTVRKVGAK